MSGEKKGLSAAIESDLYAKEKGLENQITKIATIKRKKASNQAEKYHCQSFQENNFTISKNQSQQIKQQSLLRNQIHGLIIPHFYIYNLLCNLYQLTEYNAIRFLFHLKVSHYI